MTRSELHEFIASSTGNEKNICQIHAIKDEKTVFDDCWPGYTADNRRRVCPWRSPPMSLFLYVFARYSMALWAATLPSPAAFTY